MPGSTKLSDTEVVLLAREVVRVDAAKSDLQYTAPLLRVPAFLVWVVGGIILAGYGTELSMHFKISHELMWVIIAVLGCLLFQSSEIATLRRRVDAMSVLLSSKDSDA